MLKLRVYAPRGRSAPEDSRLFCHLPGPSRTSPAVPGPGFQHPRDVQGQYSRPHTGLGIKKRRDHVWGAVERSAPFILLSVAAVFTWLWPCYGGQGGPASF